MSVVTCFYHPDIEALKKCERCRRPICLNDEITMRHRTSSGTGENTLYSYYTETLCKLCHLNRGIFNRENPNWFVFGFISMLMLIFFLFGNFFILSVLEFYERSNSFGFEADIFSQLIEIPFLVIPFIFAYVIPIGFILFVRKGLKENPQKLIELKQDREDFINTISSREVKENYSNLKEEYSLNCFNCGSNISIKDKFCNNCGDSTKDEIKRVNFSP